MLTPALPPQQPDQPTHTLPDILSRACNLLVQVYNLDDVERRGDDLHSVLRLPLYHALLGGSVPVDTVRGQRLLQVPPGELHGGRHMLCLFQCTCRMGVSTCCWASWQRHLDIAWAASPRRPTTQPRTLCAGTVCCCRPAGTQHGQQLCVQGAGVARSCVDGIVYGHHFFRVTVMVPSAASASVEELELLQALAAAVQQQPAADSAPPASGHHQDAQRRRRVLQRSKSTPQQPQQQQQPQQGMKSARAAGQHTGDPPEAAA